MARRDLMDRLPERQLDPSLATRTYVARTSGAYGGTRRANVAPTRGGAGGGGAAGLSAGSTQTVATLPADPADAVTGTIYHVQGTDGEDDRLVYAIRKADGTLEYREVTQREENWPAAHVGQFGGQGNGNGQFDVAVRDVAARPDSGDVYVSSDNRIQRFTANGTWQATVATVGTAVGTVTTPWGLDFTAVSPARVLSADGNGRVQGWSISGWVSNAGGSYSAGMRGLAVGATIFHVVETDNHRIQSALGDTYGTQGSGIGEFESPVGIAAQEIAANVTRLFVADTGNNRIQVVDVIDPLTTPTYVPRFTIGALGGSKGQFKAPQGVGVDRLGNIYVVDSGNHRIQVFDQNGVFQGQWGEFGAGEGEFMTPIGIVITDDYIYVCDSDNFRVQIFVNPVAQPLGEVITLSKQSTAGVSNTSTSTYVSTVTINTYNDGSSLILPAGTWDFVADYAESFFTASVATWGVIARLNGTAGASATSSAAALSGGRASIQISDTGQIVSDGVTVTTFRAEFTRNASWAATPQTESGHLTVFLKRVA